MKPRVNIVGSKWVFRMKKDSQGNVTLYHACLVTQGYTQVDRINYYSNQTFTAVCKLPSIQMILAEAIKNNWDIKCMDVKSAYLYGTLDDTEVIYMRPPPHVKLKELTPNKVLRLKVSLYGLKQSG
ncbi:hypothetical protein AX16_009096 [Volvariella volvacea WC 439]|nr:hypothetical protein AX16_009096 [Volvariella volvacea WC 439]